MGLIPEHSTWLSVTDSSLKSVDGKLIVVYELKPDFKNELALVRWAAHFRNHYCLDTNLDKYRRGTGKSRSEYLVDYVFPTNEDFGPATRSGDFAEILLADLLEYQFGFWVPRTRYARKTIRNESTKGADIVGFQFQDSTNFTASKADVLTTIESKAQMSGNKPKAKLQEAVVDSVKDKMRLGESLNAIKQRLYEDNKDIEAERIERFQEGIKVPYIRNYGAGAVFCSSVYQKPHVCGTTDCSSNENVENLMLIVVHAEELMKLVNSLYQRAANEA